MTTLQRSNFGTGLLMNFTTYHSIYILEFATTENYNKREISMVGQSGCGLGIKYKKSGEWGKE